MREEERLGAVRVPGEGGELELFRRGREFSLRARGTELMNSLVHESEEKLAELACARIAGAAEPVVLVGGLGMGFTLAAALRALGPKAEVVVAELMQAVVDWNRGPLAHLAGRPLDDPRVRVRVQDVARILQVEERAFDAVLLDVDNGPEGFTREANDWLYGEEGLACAASALRPGGVLGVWSATPRRDFTPRLRRVGFDVEEVRVSARSRGRGDRHVIWLGGVRR